MLQTSKVVFRWVVGPLGPVPGLFAGPVVLEWACIQLAAQVVAQSAGRWVGRFADRRVAVAPVVVQTSEDQEEGLVETFAYLDPLPGTLSSWVLFVLSAGYSATHS